MLAYNYLKLGLVHMRDDGLTIHCIVSRYKFERGIVRIFDNKKYNPENA
jgi:hypothetical protein